MEPMIIHLPILALVDSQLTVVGLILLLLGIALLVFILKRAKPRPELNIVMSDPPVRNPSDPAFMSRRARAAAAAMVYHRKRHVSGELDEKS